MLDIISISLGATAFFISLIAAGLAFFAWSTVVGLKNSTHRVQYIPVKDPEFNKYTDKDLKEQVDDETGFPIPMNEDTGAGLVKAFKQNLYQDEED